jgi:HK97 gp10 family phage protein
MATKFREYGGSRNAITKKTIRVYGIEELAAQLSEITKRVDASDEVKKAYMKAALFLRDAARAKAPVGPTRKYKGTVRHGGTLRSAIFAAYGNRDKNNVLVGVNRRIAPHAHWIEFGNARRTKAQPYMRPAVSESRMELGGILRDELLRIIKEPPKTARRFF